MIAPIREPDSRSASDRRRWIRARMAVASSLFPSSKPRGGDRPLALWKAWLWASWIVVVSSVYLGRLVARLLM